MIELLQYHELADALPLIEGEEWDAFLADVKARGLVDPVIVTYQGKILDGRNRYRACLELDITPRFREFKGKGAAAYVLSANVHRRHLTAGQRVALFIEGGLISTHQKHGPKPKQDNRIPSTQFDLSISDVAARASVSKSTVSNVLSVARDAPDLYEQVRSGEKAGNVAYREYLEREIKQRSSNNRKKQKEKKHVEDDKEVARFLDLLKQFGKASSDILTSLAKFSPEARPFTIRKLRELRSMLEQLIAALES